MYICDTLPTTLQKTQCLRNDIYENYKNLAAVVLYIATANLETGILTHSPHITGAKDYGHTPVWTMKYQRIFIARNNAMYP